MARTVHLSDSEPLNIEHALEAGDGLHSLANDEINGVQVFARVEGGQVTAYQAKRDGAVIESFMLHESPADARDQGSGSGSGSGSGGQDPYPPELCYYCFVSKDGWHYYCILLPCIF